MNQIDPNKDKNMNPIADGQSKEELYRQNIELKAVFDNAADGILMADLENKKFYNGNNAICRMLGYSAEEIKRLGVADIHPEKDLPYVMDQFERQMKGEFTLSRDLPVKRKDGSVFYADVNATVIKIAGKTYLLGYFHDTTARKKIEEELKLKNEETEQMNKLMVGRELKMAQMKKEIEELKEKIGPEKPLS
jgi:PAS domain S-box-containing protein